MADFVFFIVAQLHACVLCIALPVGLVVVPTQGFYFAFAVVVVALEEERMVYLDQQHFGRKEQTAVVVVEG